MQPTTAIARADLSLTFSEFSTLANRAGYIGMQVMPVLGVSQEAASFPRVKLESLLQQVEDTERAPRSTYNRDTFDWGDDSYACKEHGVEEEVDDGSIETWGDMIRLETIANERAINRILQALEFAIRDVIESVGNTTAAAVAWSDVANATPITDVKNAVNQVWDQCGQRPNTLQLTQRNLQEFTETDQVLERLKYWGGDDPKQITLQAVARMCEVDDVVVANGYQNSGDKGQTASLGRIWDDNKACVLRVLDDGLDGDISAPTAHFGRTIFTRKSGEPIPGSDGDGSDSLMMEEYREEQRRGGVMRARNKRQVKKFYDEAAHGITGI